MAPPPTSGTRRRGVLQLHEPGGAHHSHRQVTCRDLRDLLIGRHPDSTDDALSASPLRGGSGRSGKVPANPDGCKVVHELLLTRSPPGIGVSVTRPRRQTSSVLLALLGPVALRVKAARVFRSGLHCSCSIRPRFSPAWHLSYPSSLMGFTASRYDSQVAAPAPQNASRSASGAGGRR